MTGFFEWFFAFITTMVEGIWKILSGLFTGIVQIFNIPQYIEQFALYSGAFTVVDWIFSILGFILVFAIWGVIIYLLILGVLKFIRYRRNVYTKEDLLDELGKLHKDIIRLNNEKEKIMAMKIGSTGITIDEVRQLLEDANDQARLETEMQFNTSEYTAANAEAEEKEKAIEKAASEQTKDAATASRFYRLTNVDEKYKYYQAPEYANDFTLEELCDNFRYFCCTQLHLYYDIKTVRLLFAGLASTKLIILQGISGTGKTSFPYAMGKYFKHDASIASVQPSWRDRTELFGYFNEFTKKYNETEVLRRIYEAGYNDDINVIILDEMNIARVEYYFAEMLSILEMPDEKEWKIELVPSSWNNDPEHLQNGILHIPANCWYIGTANNDDSTFSISDKVYDRAFTINLDSKGEWFDCPVREATDISYSYVESLYNAAKQEHKVSEQSLKSLQAVDLYTIQHFRVAFGNRILKQLNNFVPVYVACGGTEVGGIDYVLATKIFRKFEALNLSLIKDEIDGLIDYLDRQFGKGEMVECITYLKRLKKMY